MRPWVARSPRDMERSSAEPGGSAAPGPGRRENRFVGFIDGFITESVLRDADELRRARLAVGGVLIGILAFGVMTVVQSTRGSALIAAIVLASGVALLLTLETFRRTGSLRFLAHAIPALLFAQAVAVMVGTSGQFIGSLYAAGTLIPLASVMLSGWRAGLAWTLAFAAATAVLMGADEWRQAPLVALDPVRLEGSNLRGTVLMAFVSLGVAFYYEWLRTGAMREAQRARRELDRYRQQLEDRVEERTRELDLSRSQLADQQRLAGIGTLAAGIAHQINNPIGGILAAAQYSRAASSDTQLDPQIARALSDIESEAVRCGRIVHGLLQFARDEPTRKWVEDLNVVLQQVKNATRAYAEERAGTVTVIPAAEPAQVEMNPIAVEQVFVNLIRNGLEARPDAPAVECTVEVDDEVVRVQVTDNGEGIAPQARDHIFDPFFTTRTRHGGTGLGLSVSHGIVSDHGGQLRVASEPGKQTTFVVEFPRHVGPAPSENGS